MVRGASAPFPFMNLPRNIFYDFTQKVRIKMLYVLLNNRVFRVDEGYLDEPLDNVYPLYPLDSDEPVGSMRADVLQQVGMKVPACYQELFEKRVYAKALKEYQSIDIRVVLRLIVNNEKHIHYLIGPVCVDDITIREGGQYFAFKDDSEGNPVLYGADTGLILKQCLENNISACANKQLVVLHDKYFEAAINKLKEMHLLKDVCVPSVQYSEWKEPPTVVPPVGEEENNHGPHCEWCKEMGLNGLHLWANDGNVYDDGSHTTHSHYRRIENCKP